MEKNKAIVMGILLKIDVGNPNAGWPEGVVTVLKKVELPEMGTVHPYISGQAMRRYIRDTLKDLTGEEAFSPPEVIMKKVRKKTSDEAKDEKGEDVEEEVVQRDTKAPIVTMGNPGKYIDDDLFGFMRAIKGRGKTKKRESPLRVSPAFALFPYMGDRDLGTRSAIEATQEAEAGGSIFETEITNNIFKATILLELDRVGRWKTYETTDKEGAGELDAETRTRRVTQLLESLKYLWGGGRRTRFLVDLSPQFIIYSRMTKKIPIWLHALQVTADEDGYRLNIPVLDEVVKDYAESEEKLILGLRKGFLENYDEIREWAEGKVEVYSVGEAIDKMVEDVKGTEF